MVLDEVDAGIGGAVAEIVGRELRALGAGAQVLCVTHLPQVACQAHHQLRVTKLTDGRTTRITVSELSAKDRVEELARMLGGIEVSGKAREHAREVLHAATLVPGKAVRGEADHAAPASGDTTPVATRRAVARPAEDEVARRPRPPAARGRSPLLLRLRKAQFGRLQRPQR